jgi:hypothetical protein
VKREIQEYVSSEGSPLRAILALGGTAAARAAMYRYITCEGQLGAVLEYLAGYDDTMKEQVCSLVEQARSEILEIFRSYVPEGF